MKLPLIIANWKANLTTQEVDHWLARAIPHLKSVTRVEVVICPSYLGVLQVKAALKGTDLQVGSQNVSQFPHGKYTGEVPVELLSGLVRFGIVGHSERRKYFEETNQIIAEKVKKLAEYHIKPIVCVENIKDVEELSDLIKTRDLVIAYEPTFAIGSGTPDTPEHAGKMAQKIKLNFGEGVKVIYGGSATADNIEGFLRQTGIEGSLVGTDSLNPEDFVALVSQAEGL